ncbi:hypothetical protein LTR17_006772 [Elasticomyces elasticus]|nr:hypothetical protein LTR17_006772 [Elasticomyces elasticus]
MADGTTPPRRDTYQQRSPPSTSTERVAHAAEQVLHSNVRMSSTMDVQAEMNQRRALYKVPYQSFEEASELRRQKVMTLIAQNDRWNAEIADNNKAIAKGGDGAASLTAKNKTIKEMQDRAKKEAEGDVDGAKGDIATQKKWDNYFEIRSDDPPL